MKTEHDQKIVKIKMVMQPYRTPVKLTSAWCGANDFNCNELMCGGKWQGKWSAKICKCCTDGAAINNVQSTFIRKFSVFFFFCGFAIPSLCLYTLHMMGLRQSLIGIRVDVQLEHTNRIVTYNENCIFILLLSVAIMLFFA